MARNIMEIKNPGGSNHFEQHVPQVIWFTVYVMSENQYGVLLLQRI